VSNNITIALAPHRLPCIQESHTANATTLSAHDKEQPSMTDMAAANKKSISTKQLADTLAEQHQFTKKQGHEMLEDLVGLITKHLKKGERVKIVGLGILQVRNRAARVGRNPATGEPIQIKASKKVAFRASKDLKMAI
jgi:DNA-binding protein HU-beta